MGCGAKQAAKDDAMRQLVEHRFQELADFLREQQARLLDVLGRQSGCRAKDTERELRRIDLHLIASTDFSLLSEERIEIIAEMIREDTEEREQEDDDEPLCECRHCCDDD